MILQPSQDVAGMAGLGWGKQEDTGDTAGVGGVVTHPFHYKGASFLRVQTVHGRRNEGEVEREGEAPESDGNVCSPTEEGTPW